MSYRPTGADGSRELRRLGAVARDVGHRGSAGSQLNERDAREGYAWEGVAGGD